MDVHQPPKQQDVYSVWALPPPDVSERVKKLMVSLRSEFGGPEFEPHVTVVGAIRLTEDEAREKLIKACEGLKVYHATVEKVETGTFFYQCVFLLLHKTPQVLETGAHCWSHFGYKSQTPYMPHLSILYADLTEEEKKKAQEKANALDESIESLSFPITRLALYKTDTEDKTLKSWEKVSEIQGCLNSAMRSILVNGLYKRIHIDDPLTSSHLFYADDAVFIGKWDKSNLITIVNVLNYFFLASGLKINLHKNKLMGISIPQEDVNMAAISIGCTTLTMPFKYLGVKVGAFSSRSCSCEDVLANHKDMTSYHSLFIFSISMDVQQHNWYSVWAVLPQDVTERVKKVMNGLRSEFGGPEFEPHVTVVHAIRLAEDDAREKLTKACDGLKAYNMTIEKVEETGRHILLHKTPEVMQTGAHCWSHFGYKSETPYMPHLSILYGDLTEEEKKRAQEKANALDGSIKSLSFPVTRLALYKTDPEDTTLKSWEKVSEVTLKSN
ncbi:cyclic phosphodiesterase-like protein [Tanacetum coccineum]